MNEIETAVAPAVPVARGSYDCDVLVVGGGPAGALLALLLARKGARTLLIERHADFDREYRGEVLMPRFTRLFRQLGLEPLIDRLPHRRLQGSEFHWMERKIATIRFDHVSPEIPYALWTPQPALLGALAEAGAAHPSYSLWFDCIARDLIRSNGRIVGAVVQRGKEEIEVRCHAVVGADGRFSTLRRLGGFKLAYERHDFDVLWFTVPEPKDMDPTFRVFLTPPAGYLALPKYPNLLQCGMLLSPDDMPKFHRQGIESLRALLLQGPGFIRDFARGLKDFSQLTLLRANIDLVEDWERDGLVLIGDAAHTCSPAGAVGVSMAVESAAVAAEVLLECLQAGDFGKDRLDHIQQRREPLIREIHKRQIGMGNTIGATTGGRRRFLSIMLPLLAPLGIMERTMRPLVVGRPLEIRPDGAMRG